MAIGPFYNPLIRIDGVDLSDHATKVTINQEGEELDATAFNPTGTKATRVGLISGSIDVEFLQDDAAQSVNATLAPLQSSRSSFFVYIQKDRDLALSATNPGYQGKCVLPKYTPVDAGVGELSKVTVTMPLYSGSIIEVTSGTYS